MTITNFKIKPRGSSTSYDAKKVVNSIKWATDINYSAGELTFNLVHLNNEYVPDMGDIVAFSWNEKKVFYGYIFKVTYSSADAIQCTAYDSLRYLKNQDSIVWPTSTLTQRFERIAKSAGLKYKVVNSSTHKLKTEVADQKTYFDMLQKYIGAVHRATGNRYYLRDNYGVLELLNRKQTYTNLILGDKSLLTDFTYDESIDNAFNSVKLVREDKHSHKRKVITYNKKTKKKVKRTKTTTTTTQHIKRVSDSDTIKHWGKLQKTEQADSDLNDAQMLTKAKQLLKKYNKSEKSLKLSAIGILGIRAGSSFYLDINQLRDVGIGKRRVFATKVTHTFDDDWTMDLEVNI